MKCEELISFVNENSFLSLGEFEAYLLEKLDEENDRFLPERVSKVHFEAFSSFIKSDLIYLCIDGYVAISGVSALIEEGLTPEDIAFPCYAEKVEKRVTVEYVHV